MSVMIRSLAVLVAMAGGMATLALAEETAPAAAAAPAKDRFKVPEGNDAKVLLEFLKNLANAEVTESTPETIRAYLVKFDDAVAEIMSRDVDAEVIAECVQTRESIFATLEKFGAPEIVAPRKSAMLERLKSDERPEIQRIVARLDLVRRIQMLTRSTQPERQQVVQEIVANLEKVPEGDDEALQEAITFMLATIQLLDRLEDKADAIAALQLFSKNVELRKDRRLRGVVRDWQGMSRRLNLPGNTVEITGRTLTGEEFDLKQWKGKVVLVDFWATWCPSCIQELPNMQAMYKAYHDKGFEIVGVSCDEDKFDLQSFVAREKLPWPILFEESALTAGMENPNATRYGINVLPVVILVDQEGKVVTLNATGPVLADHLERLLGPIPEPAESKNPSEGK